MSRDLLIIGIGNEFRSDDAAGILVARRLREILGDGVDVRELSGEGGEIIELLGTAKSVIIIDAVSSDSEAGTVHYFDGHQQEIPSEFFNYSTHDFSLAEAVEMARVLGQLPPKCVIYGIEGDNFGFGQSLTPSTKAAIDKVCSMIEEDISVSA